MPNKAGLVIVEVSACHWPQDFCSFRYISHEIPQSARICSCKTHMRMSVLAFCYITRTTDRRVRSRRVSRNVLNVVRSMDF